MAFRRMKHLQRRGHVYWIRRPIPRRLWSILGKREYLVSLKTGDVRLAETRALAELPKIERAILAAEKKVSLVTTPDLHVPHDHGEPDDQGTAVNEHVTGVLAGEGRRTLTQEERAQYTALLHRDHIEENPPLSL